MNNIFQEFTVVLTGAYGGIGKALARQLVDAGCNVYLVGRNEEKLQTLTAELKTSAKPKQVIYYFQADLADPESVSQLASRLCYATPQINVLINNAGVNHLGTLDNTQYTAVQNMINVNVLAPMQLTKLLLPRLKAMPWARIVNVGSVLGLLGYPGYSAYCTSKFALKGFSESLQRELTDSSVSVGYFAARATDTPLNSSAIVEMNKALNTKVDKPEEVAEKIINFIPTNKSTNKVAWPECIFIKLNAILPDMVSNSIKKQLPIIKRYAAV